MCTIKHRCVASFFLMGTPLGFYGAFCFLPVKMVCYHCSVSLLLPLSSWPLCPASKYEYSLRFSTFDEVLYLFNEAHRFGSSLFSRGVAFAISLFCPCACTRSCEPALAPCSKGASARARTRVCLEYACPCQFREFFLKVMDVNACRSEFLIENIEAFRVCIPHDVAQQWRGLTVHKLLGIILEMTSGLPRVVRSFWQKATAIS